MFDVMMTPERAWRQRRTVPLYLSRPSRQYDPMPCTLHGIAIDRRNRNILISVNGELYTRAKALAAEWKE